MEEVNVPSNKIPKSLHLVDRGVHLVVSGMISCAGWYTKIDYTEDFRTVNQAVQDASVDKPSGEQIS
ncbi:hypothetical protein J6590_077278 [Homalodisca vitripennis]|nr:hypothetical protein J6590_077278 [Homalodisca vitripennis]